MCYTDSVRSVGVDDGEVPPVPIPNTEVKLTCAEDSQLETACENRQSPTFMWPVGQAVKTEASHAFNIGSIPVRVIFAPLAQLVEQLTLNQWAQGSSPWRCTTTTKSELFPIGEGFGFFVFFGKQNESIASPEK